MSQQKRPAYSQPSIMPRKQWVVVKTERVEDDDLIVVSGEEGAEDEEDEDERSDVELARERDRSNFNISNVRSLSAELGGRAESDMDSQVSLIRASWKNMAANLFVRNVQGWRPSRYSGGWSVHLCSY